MGYIKGENFDEWYDQQIAEVNAMSMEALKKRRKKYIAQLEGLHVLMRDIRDGLTGPEKPSDAKRKYYKGRRKFLTRIISHTNDRIKLFNLVAHNGVPQNLANAFVKIASQKLPADVFQRIYGLAAMSVEYDAAGLDMIRIFIMESKKKVDKNL